MSTSANAVVNSDDGDDQDAYVPERKSYAKSGWNGIFGFMDGVRGISDRVVGLTDDYADIATNVNEGRRSNWELDRDKEEFSTSQLLAKLKVQRGDNVQMYYVAGAVAAAVVVLVMIK